MDVKRLCFVATNLCQKFRGQMNVITSEQNNEEVMTLIRESDYCQSIGKIYNQRKKNFLLIFN